MVFMKRADSKSVDFIEIIAEVRKVTRTTKGGRIFSFRVTVIIGDGRGGVGYGIAAHSEVIEAKQKAINQAKRRMKKISLRENRTVHHTIFSKYGASKIFMRSAKPGSGIIAGSTSRKICEAVGLQDVVVKSYGSSAPHLVAMNMIRAFEMISSPKDIAKKRAKRVSEIVKNRLIV
ncbi:30S ribosomal protein S5 [Anaplasmataceae bacterium AB001_6]|nr:30S ribosomal protein S5 [Anaplasmataceae bacterium AB001_6]